MASLWYRVNQPPVQSSVYTGQCVDPYEYVTYFISYGTLQYIIHALGLSYTL